MLIVSSASPLLDTDAATAVAEATRDLPASWVTRGNATPLRVKAVPPLSGVRGTYLPTLERMAPLIDTDATPGNALHEYVHHMQAVMPGLDGLFQTLHARRNKGTKPRALKNYRARGRKDAYVDPYFGAEYDGTMLKRFGYNPKQPALEVITRAIQITFHDMRVHRPDGTVEIIDIGTLVRKDPEMLDLVLGVLFRYDP